MLTDPEDRLIELLAVADGAFVHVAVIAEVLNTRKLAVESVSERLTQFGLLIDSLGPSGTLLKLSPRGRDYALEHKIIGDQSLADRLHEVAMDRSGRI